MSKNWLCQDVMREWESGHMSVNLYMVYIMDRMSRFDTAEKTEQSCGLLWDWWPVLCECPIPKLNLQSVINSTAAFRLIPLVLYPPEKGQFTGCPVWINNYMRLLWTGAHTHFTGCYDTGFYRILSFFFNFNRKILDVRVINKASAYKQLSTGVPFL